MKYSKIFYSTFALASLMLASCNNDYPEFDDAEAFAAFTSTSMGVGEKDSILEVPVLFTSLSGKTAEVSFEIVAEGEKAPVKDVDFKVEGDGKLRFTKEAPTQNIVIKVIDNDKFTGDRKFTINLVAGGVKLGASKSCVVTIEDDEHPLQAILGTYAAKATSGFNGETEFEMIVKKDEEDLSKVWISNIVPGGTSLYVYGMVNEEKTEIHIPVGQELAKSSTYPHIILEGFYGPDAEEDIPTGGYITFKIPEEGTLTSIDWYTSSVYTDDACTNLAGYYNYFKGDLVAKKK